MAPKKRNASNNRPCAIWVPKSQRVIGGEALGLSTIIPPKTSFRVSSPQYGKPHVAIVMHFPLGDNPNTTVFNDKGSVTDDFTVTLQFISGQFEVIRAQKLTDDVYHMIMGKEDASENVMYHVHLRSISGPRVVGFPNPCPTTNEYVDRIINRSSAIGLSEISLHELISEHDFHLVFKNSGIGPKAETGFQNDLVPSPTSLHFPYGSK